MKEKTLKFDEKGKLIISRKLKKHKTKHFSEQFKVRELIRMDILSGKWKRSVGKQGEVIYEPQDNAKVGIVSQATNGIGSETFLIHKGGSIVVFGKIAHFHLVTHSWY